MATRNLSLLLFIAISVPIQATANKDYRLPDFFKPIKYDVTLTLADDVFDTEIFSGELTLLFEVSQETDSIVLHANGLNISGANLVTSLTPVIITNTDFTSDPETDKFEIKVSSNLTQSLPYELFLKYTGSLRSDLYGLYKSSYEEGGETKYLAATQFEPTHARKVFPCFDEPSFKAKFKNKIVHPAHLTVISNVPIIGHDLTDDNRTAITTISITPPMSTYLVAFIISEFTCTPGKPLGGYLAFQLCSRNETTQFRDYALDVGTKIMNSLDAFTGIQYSSRGAGKMDIAAIPDLAPGAMENWGLVTYRESDLLYDPKDTPNSLKQEIALVIAHEFAHMWFGDLVTMDWWSDVFLNEGWARFLEYIITNEVEKTWELDHQIVVDVVQRIMQNDAVESALALSSQAATSNQVSCKFGGITYDKGASILRMVQHIMGFDNFKLGVNAYLNQFNYSNAEPSDLWNSFHEFSLQEGNLPKDTQLKDVMLNWVNKSGFPVLTVGLKGKDIVISQERFLISGNASKDDQWYVPISLTKSTDSSKFAKTNPSYWLLPNEDLTLSNIVSDDVDNWIIINNQQTAYYRVNYDEELWNRIAAALKKANFDGIHVLNRAQIVDDLFNFAKTGRLTYSRVFDLVEFLNNDLSYYPWYSMFQAISHMWDSTSNSQVRKDLSSYSLKLMENFLGSVSFDVNADDDHMYTLKRVLALTWACKFGDEDCIKKSLDSFKSYRESDTKPSKNLKTIVYCTALSNSKDIITDVNFLWDKYTEETLQNEKLTILTSLGCTSDETILKEYLKKSISASSGIRPQDAVSVFTSVYSGSLEGVDVALDFLIDNHQAIVANYGSINSINNMITGLSERFTEEAQISKLEDFLKTPGVNEDLISAAKEAVASAKINFEWTVNFEKQLTEYFKGKRSSASRIYVQLATILFGVFFYIIV